MSRLTTIAAVVLASLAVAASTASAMPADPVSAPPATNVVGPLPRVGIPVAREHVFITEPDPAPVASSGGSSVPATTIVALGALAALMLAGGAWIGHTVRYPRVKRLA